MKNEERIAKEVELAEYPCGTMVHVGLVTGHNDGIDESGFDHRAFFQEQKEKGIYPQRFAGIRVKAVREHVNAGKKVLPYWSMIPEDVERILNDPESVYHKMAKDACIGLLRERKFNDIVKTKLPLFEFGGCQAELPIAAAGHQHFADVGVWDHRFPNNPIAMEITYTSGQTKERILRLTQAGIHVYNFNIRDRTRDELREGREPSIKFYRDAMLKSKFSLRKDTESDLKLDAEYLNVARVKAEAERKREMDRAQERRLERERMYAREEEEYRRLQREGCIADRPKYQPISDEERAESKRQADEYAERIRREREARLAQERKDEERRRQAERKEAEIRATYKHGISVAENPMTWTGRIVSKDDWHNLSDWEKHGPDGNVWWFCECLGPK